MVYMILGACDSCPGDLVSTAPVIDPLGVRCAMFASFYVSAKIPCTLTIELVSRKRELLCLLNVTLHQRVLAGLVVPEAASRLG